jgi:hypothetical protein
VETTAADNANAARSVTCLVGVVIGAPPLVEDSIMSMPEHKPAPERFVRFVQVPRDVFFEKYADASWTDLITAAQAERDGLQMIDANYFGLPYAARDTVWLRENPAGGFFLYHQNW